MTSTFRIGNSDTPITLNNVEFHSTSCIPKPTQAQLRSFNTFMQMLREQRVSFTATLSDHTVFDPYWSAWTQRQQQAQRMIQRLIKKSRRHRVPLQRRFS